MKVSSFESRVSGFEVRVGAGLKPVRTLSGFKMGLMDFEENRFRYKVEALAAVQMENQLNFLGAEGWELVSVIFHPEKEYPYLCFFKQRVSG